MKIEEVEKIFEEQLVTLCNSDPLRQAGEVLLKFVCGYRDLEAAVDVVEFGDKIFCWTEYGWGLNNEMDEGPYYDDLLSAFESVKGGKE